MRERHRELAWDLPVDAALVVHALQGDGLALGLGGLGEGR
jgi:hypothetical protein